MPGDLCPDVDCAGGYDRAVCVAGHCQVKAITP
jgi:hypothetical protein